MRLPGRRSGPRRVGARPTRAATRSLRGDAGRSLHGTAARPDRAAPIALRFRLPRPTRLPRFTPARAGALLGIIASLGGIYGLAATTAFTYARAEIPELRWTTRAAVETAIGIPEGANLFRVAVGPLEDRIRALPGVAEATVAVALPDTLVVDVTERDPILAWGIAERRFLVDVDGVLFAEVDTAAVTAADLPVIDDSRAESVGLAVGDHLDPVSLDAARRLGSLVPGDVGSVAGVLLVTVSDATGFVVGTSPPSWVAVFGLYTPNVRPPTIIPEQVRLLRSLLLERGEADVLQATLADPDRGTVIMRPTPAPSP